MNKETRFSKVFLITVIAIGIIFYIYFLRTGKKPAPAPSDIGEEKLPLISMSTSLEKPTSVEEYGMMTEYYTDSDLVDLSTKVKIKLTLNIDKAYLITKITITRSVGVEKRDTKVITNQDFKKGDNIIFFESKQGENMIATHKFSVTYTSALNSVDIGGPTTEVTINYDDISLLETSDSDTVINSDQLLLQGGVATTVYDVYYTPGSYDIVSKGGEDYTFYILGARGMPVNRTDNPKGAYVSFSTVAPANFTYKLVVGGSGNVNIEYGWAGNGGTVIGTANNGYRGGGFSGIFSGSVDRANAIGIAGGSGGAANGENTSWNGPGGPGRGDVADSNTSMKGVDGENGYKVQDWYSMAGGGGGGGGYSGGARGLSGSESRNTPTVTGGTGGTSYVDSLMTNKVIEAGPSNNTWPTGWETIRKQLNLDPTNNGAIIVSYTVYSPRESVIQIITP